MDGELNFFLSELVGMTSTVRIDRRCECVGSSTNPSSRAVTLHFADVVHQSEELPLRRHLAPPAMTEATEPMGASNVGKHWLHDPEPSTVTVSPKLAVDLTLHLGRVGFRFTFGSANEQRHLPLHGSVGIP